MKKSIEFLSVHITKEEFVEDMLERDYCPMKFNLIPDFIKEGNSCAKNISCDDCWESALKGITFKESEENE